MFLWTWLVVLNVSKRGRQMWITEEQVRWITMYMSIMPLWLMKWFCEIEVTPASLWSLKLIAEIYMLIYVPLVLTYIAGLKKNWIFLVGFYHPVFSSDYIFQNHQKGRFVYFTPLSFLGGCPSQRSSVLFSLFFFFNVLYKKVFNALFEKKWCLPQAVWNSLFVCVCERESGMVFVWSVWMWRLDALMTVLMDYVLSLTTSFLTISGLISQPHGYSLAHCSS